MVHSPDFFQKILEHFLLRVGLFCMTLVEQLRVGDDDRWYVQLAAIRHWYLPLSICIALFVFCSFVSGHSCLISLI